MWKRWFWWIFPGGSIYRFYCIIHTGRYWFLNLFEVHKFDHAQLHTPLGNTAHPTAIGPDCEFLATCGGTTQDLRRVGLWRNAGTFGRKDAGLVQVSSLSKPLLHSMMMALNKDPKLRICTVTVWNNWIVLMQLDVMLSLWKQPTQGELIVAHVVMREGCFPPLLPLRVGSILWFSRVTW